MPAAKKSVKKVQIKETAPKIQVKEIEPAEMPSEELPKPEVRWKYFWGGFRILTGFLFLWPFLDKLFGFGISTARSAAWINGGSPTAGFLSHGTQGPFASIFQSLSSSHIVAWLFMLGLLFVGLTMILGIGLKLSAIVGTVMLFLMWSALLWPSDNPFLDYHWFYAFALIAAALTKSGDFIGLGKWWRNIGFVRSAPILE